MENSEILHDLGVFHSFTFCLYLSKIATLTVFFVNFAL